MNEGCGGWRGERALLLDEHRTKVEFSIEAINHGQ